MLLSGLLGLYSYTTSDHLLRGGASHSGLGPPTPPLIKKMHWQPKGQSDGGNSSTNTLLPR